MQIKSAIFACLIIKELKSFLYRNEHEEIEIIIFLKLKKLLNFQSNIQIKNEQKQREKYKKTQR